MKTKTPVSITVSADKSLLAVSYFLVAVLVDEERPGEPSTLGLYHATGGRSEVWIYRRPHVRGIAFPPDRHDL